MNDYFNQDTNFFPISLNGVQRNLYLSDPQHIRRPLTNIGEIKKINTYVRMECKSGNKYRNFLKSYFIFAKNLRRSDTYVYFLFIHPMWNLMK